ncbi:unnamed protein product [Allacma fusca]|uniref:Uncharacterized protein n=1 Tax=Allacma fusca TaxID=39272 RepID=A0A8J2NTB0_9HEXA|nr:unnamed protein product [Allacma fusca]
MLQGTWELKCGWDAELPEEIASNFRKWTSHLSLLTEVKIPSGGESAERHLMQAVQHEVFLQKPENFAKGN